MNAERLLEVYEQISEAPDALARLRRFVLDLAMHGKLVEQDAGDEPAFQLLERISQEKAHLLRKGVIKKKSDLPPVAQCDQPHSLPNNWTWVRFANIVDFSAGRTPSRNDTSYWNTGDFNWVSIADMVDGQVVGETKETVSSKAKKDAFKSDPAPPGTMIMSFKLTIGKMSRLGLHAYHNEAIISIRPHLPKLDPYLFKVLPDLARGGETKGAIKGATLNRDSISNILIPLPPLSEQHRIVAKVDELMALCDRLEEARETREETRDKLTAASLARLTASDTTPEDFPAHANFALEALPALTTRPDQIKTLRQTILNLAVRGKLAEQDPADEPASHSLTRLKQAAAQVFRNEGLRARKSVAAATRQDLKFDFPGKWELPIFDDVFVMVSGVTKGGKVPLQDAQVRPYLRVANVQRGHLDLSVIKTIEVKTADAERYRLKDGDILMTEGGDWDKLGRAAIWRCEIEECIHQNHIFRVRPPSEDILADWVITYVNSELGRSFFEDASKQTTNLASINMTQLRGCPLPLPPLAEQHRIVAKVYALMALCDRLETALATTDTTRARLLEALLHEALEPATEVLEAAE